MERSLGASAIGLLPSSPATHDTCDRPVRGDDIMAELARGLHPRERPDWEETISAMARSAEVPDLRSNTASTKVKSAKKLSFSKSHFPKLAECAHFHYENVDFGNLQLSLADEASESSRNGLESKEGVYLVQIHCQGRNWIVRRSYEDFRILDKHLHLCIYDRRYSQLADLPREQPEAVSPMLIGYLTRLSAIADNRINCGPALTWMELDNKGNHLLVHEESSINVPAIAAAHVIKRYNAQANDELSFEVGDIVSVIDMPPKEDTMWWRGKHGFQVGFFPSECVELINDKIPQSVSNCVPKPVCKKHGKLITFLRSFMKSRPSKQKLKQRGILKERVFACDLGEHLLNSGHDVPQVLRSCAEFIEQHGIVDGIYRLSGIASNIQKLRHEFDSELIPDLTKEVYLQDIHCVGSLCKLYFRELPNPLLTYQLYDKFSDAVSAATDDERLLKIHDVIQQLPPPHYRTLEFLMTHLSQLAAFSPITNMHAKNLAIVWAPNLLRSRQIESACFGGPAAFMEVRIQSVVVEFILSHADVLFSPKLTAQSVVVEFILSHADVLFSPKLTGHSTLPRPKSLAVVGPCAGGRLLSLEEAQARTQTHSHTLPHPCGPPSAHAHTHGRYIEVGEGPAALLGKFHTVIDFPTERKRQPVKPRKSPVGNWRSFFSLGKSSSSSSSSSSSAPHKRKLRRNPSEPSELKSMALTGGRGDATTLRSAKSEESLTSLHNVEGESRLYRPRRPRSSSDALSPLSGPFGAALVDTDPQCASTSYDTLCDASTSLSHTHVHTHTHHEDSDSADDRPIFCVPALISAPPPLVSTDTDLEFTPPEVGMGTLDFDPMSFCLGATHTLSPDNTISSTSCLLESSIGQPPPSSTSLISPDSQPLPVETPPLPVGSRVEFVHNEALLLDLQGASPLHSTPADNTHTQRHSPVSLSPSSPRRPGPGTRRVAFRLDDLESPPPSCDSPSPLSPLRADELLSCLDWPYVPSPLSVAMTTPPSPLSVAMPPSKPASLGPSATPTDTTVPDSKSEANQPIKTPQPQNTATSANENAALIGMVVDAAAVLPSPCEAPQTVNTTPHATPTHTDATDTPLHATSSDATPSTVTPTPISPVSASPPISTRHQPAAVEVATAPSSDLSPIGPAPITTSAPAALSPTSITTPAPVPTSLITHDPTFITAPALTPTSLTSTAPSNLTPAPAAFSPVAPSSEADPTSVVDPPTSLVAPTSVAAPPAVTAPTLVVAPTPVVAPSSQPAPAVTPPAASAASVAPRCSTASSLSTEGVCVSLPGPQCVVWLLLQPQLPTSTQTAVLDPPTAAQQPSPTPTPPEHRVDPSSTPPPPPTASDRPAVPQRAPEAPEQPAPPLSSPPTAPEQPQPPPKVSEQPAHLPKSAEHPAPLPSRAEHPVAVLQPQPQTPRLPTSSQERRPWEAIKPVQPVEREHSAPYQPIKPVERERDRESGSLYQRQAVLHPSSSTASQQVAPPPPPMRSIQSKMAAAALSSHAYLLEGEGPALLSHTHSHTLPRKTAYVYQASAAERERLLDERERFLLDAAAEALYGPAPRSLPVSALGSLGYGYRASAGGGPELSLAYATGDVSRYATIGPRSYHHHSLKAHRPTRAEYLAPEPAPSHHHHHHHHRGHAYSGHPSQAYAYSSQPTSAYSTLRRVHSMHTPSPSLSLSASRAHPPPLSDAELFYLHHQQQQQQQQQRCHNYPPSSTNPLPDATEAQPTSEVDYHVTRLQPFFENGRVQYRYSPYGAPETHAHSHAHAHTNTHAHTPFYDLGYASLRLPRHAHSFAGGRDRDKPGAGAYHYLLHQRAHTPAHTHTPHGHSVSRSHTPLHTHAHVTDTHAHSVGVKEHGFVSRDMPPAHTHTHTHTTSGGSSVCDEGERACGRVPSLRRESRARQRLRGPPLSQYDNLAAYTHTQAPEPPLDTHAHTHAHSHSHTHGEPLRSKSDPGKEARYNVTPESALPRSHTADTHTLTRSHTPSSSHTHNVTRSHTPTMTRSHTPSHAYTTAVDTPHHTHASSAVPTRSHTPDPHVSQRYPEAEHTHTHTHGTHTHTHPEVQRRGGRSPDQDPYGPHSKTAAAPAKHERSHPPPPPKHPHPPSHYDNLEHCGVAECSSTALLHVTPPPPAAGQAQHSAPLW
ncbi:rho GTPase-activating protein 32 [Engraulis encrasicolus]|uniref:rho GTPase-activating protein 32 n=1 Tax=Engraulis encrasicolus TaxID=184585 RepID=UPI002FD199B6